MLPIRVLVSTASSVFQYSDSSDFSDEEVDVPISTDYDFHRRFLDVVFGPAIEKLGCKTLSKLKGAGDPFGKKWMIYPEDWSKVAFESDRILMANASLNGRHL